MQKLILRALPVSDLNVGYALDHGDGTYTHYFISLPTTLMSGVSAEKLVREYILKEYGPDVEIEVVGTHDINTTLHSPYERVPDSLIKTATLPFDAFSDRVIKDLTRVNSKGFLYQYMKNISPYSDRIARIHDRIGDVLNRTVFALLNRYIVKPINILLQKKYGIYDLRVAAEEGQKSFIEGVDGVMGQAIAESVVPDPGTIMKDLWRDKWSDAWKKYDEAAKGKFFLGQLYVQSSFVRSCTPCVFFVIGAGEDDLERAIVQLSDDLDLASDRKLILGNMGMPGISELANTVGNGKKIYAVYSFFILNSDRLMQLAGFSSPLEMTNSTATLQKLGFRYTVQEGGIEWLDGKRPYQNAVIKTVNLNKVQMQSDLEEMAKVQKELEDYKDRKAKRLAEEKAKQNGQT